MRLTIHARIVAILACAAMALPSAAEPALARGYNQRYLVATTNLKVPSDWGIATVAGWVNANDPKAGDNTANMATVTGTIAGGVMTVTAVTSGTVGAANVGTAYSSGNGFLGAINGSSSTAASSCTATSGSPCTGSGGTGTYALSNTSISYSGTIKIGYNNSAGVFGFTRRYIQTTWAPTQTRCLFSYRTNSVYGIDVGLTSWTVLRSEVNSGGRVIPLLLNGQPISRTNPLRLSSDHPDQWVSLAFDPPANSAMFIDTWDQISGGPGSARPGSLAPRTDLGEASSNSATAFDLAAAPTSGSSGQKVYIGPVMCVGIPADPTASNIAVALFTDSLEDQGGYIVPGFTDWGWIRAGLGSSTNGAINNIGFARYSSSGQAIYTVAAGGYPATATVGGPFQPIFSWLEDRMRELGQSAYPFNRGLYEHFRNESGAGATSTQNIQMNAIYRARTRTPGIKWFGMTPLPYTTSTDGWITEANQTESTTMPAGTRAAQITWTRASGNGALDGYLDPAAYLTSISNSGTSLNWPQIARTGTLSTTLSAVGKVLQLSFAPNVGDCLTIDPAGSIDIAPGMVVSVTGSSAPYTVTMNSNTLVANHASGVTVTARSVQDGTHECHDIYPGLVGYVAGWKTVLRQ